VTSVEIVVEATERLLRERLVDVAAKDKRRSLRGMPEGISTRPIWT
jgi:hypothetical protein